MIRPFVRLAGWACAPTAWGFRRALRNPAAAQEVVRRRLVEGLLRTRYGRDLGVRGPADWDHIPVREWDQLRGLFEEQEASTEPIVVPDPVLFWERTSGSSGGAKRIPYTAALRATFTRMLRIWAHDLITHGPHFQTGRVYFQVTPPLAEPEETSGGAPVGTADDRDFVEGWTRSLVDRFVVRPARLPRTPDEFLDAVTDTLLRAPWLEVISVWSPSFLKVVMDHAEAHHKRLVGNCKAGQVMDRVRHIEKGSTDWREVWPDLELVSCWDQGEAAGEAERLRERLPGVLIQGKGLLATEGPMTVPLLGAPGAVPLIQDVLIELESADGDLIPLHRARDGEEYGVVLSQPAGLLRYRIGDRVRVVGWQGATPCLELLGRDEQVSDMVGEKLSAAFVARALRQLELEPAFLRTLVARHPGPFLVGGAPVRRGATRDANDFDQRPGYVLLLDQGPTSWKIDALAQHLEEALREAFHYDQARQLGQLAPAKVAIAEDMADRLARAREAAGVKRGDQKPAALLRASAARWR